MIAESFSIFHSFWKIIGTVLFSGTRGQFLPISSWLAAAFLREPSVWKKHTVWCSAILLMWSTDFVVKGCIMSQMSSCDRTKIPGMEANPLDLPVTFCCFDLNYRNAIELPQISSPCLFRYTFLTILRFHRLFIALLRHSDRATVKRFMAWTGLHI